ncbi:hypothetical protein CKO42_25270 [Lamprobacter modestohalophilus]|uniref:Uncharacterized protein n=1 Tax=Lamprobacter modestohalophilus TaxID=1064514 RepID=A0A9X1B708_9GAMM|nr:hypothetical protein [Lamprobacter modestohalophilus]
MRTNTEIRSDGLRSLTASLGVIEAERFIALINRERFDYTQWRQDQWAEETVASLAQRARLLRESESPTRV